MRRTQRLLMLFGILSCACCGGKYIVLQAEHPLSQVRIHSSGEVVIEPGEGIGLSDLVDLKPFRDLGLRPGQPIEEVEGLLGPPETFGYSREGRDEVFGYERDFGTIEIVKQHVSSEGTEVDRWFLRLRVDRDGHKLVHPAILKYSPSPEAHYPHISLYDRASGGAAALDFEQGELKYLWWYVNGDDHEVNDAETPSDQSLIQ